MTFTLSGETKSTQHIYRTSCRGGFSKLFMTPEGKNLKNAHLQANEGGTRSLDPLLLCTQRRRDLDNMNKLILDALTDIAYEDDS